MAARRKASESAEEEIGFEEALDRIEGLVAQLEDGELPLEAALAAFEKGVALTRRCAARLEDAERRIEKLVKEGERWLARPLDPAQLGRSGDGD